MSEADEKRRAGLDALDRFAEENSFGNSFGGGYSSPFGRGIGTANRGTLTRSDIERFKANEGSMGFDDDFSFTPRPRQPATPVRAPAPPAVKPPEPVRTAPVPVIEKPAEEVITEIQHTAAEPVPVPPQPAEIPASAVQEPEEPAEPVVTSPEPAARLTAEERAAAELHEAWNTAAPVTDEIIVNRSRECFCVLRARNSSGRAGYEEISKGFIDIVEVRTVEGYDGTKHDFIAVRYRRDHTTADGMISREELERSPGSLLETASRNNVIFTGRRYAVMAAKYLLTVSADTLSDRVHHVSFYCDEDRIRHPDEADIYRNSASAERVKEFFLSDGDMQTVFLLCYRLLTELEASGYMQEFPVLIFNAHDPSAALSQAGEILGEKTVCRIDKHFNDAEDKRVRLYNAGHSSRYNIEKYLPEILAGTDTHPTIFAADGMKAFCGSDITRSSVIMPYALTERDLSELGGIYDFMRSAFLRCGISPEKWRQTADGIDVSEFNVYVSYLASQILLTAWMVLSEVTDKESAEASLGRLCRWILTLTEDPDDRMILRLKEFLRSGADGVSLNRSGNVHVIAETMNEYARNDMWRADFAAVLASQGIISRGELSLQRSATVNGRSYRVYEIVQDKLFSYGELRTVVNEFARSAPELSIPFAECCGQRISLAFSDMGDSSAVLITGEDAERRFEVCGSIIEGAREQGIEVVAADISDTENTSDNGVSYIHSRDKDEANGFLKELLQRKKEDPGALILLIIENAEDWDMSARSPLVGRILRSGGKYGIICCVTAKSTDIAGKYSVYIHTGEFGFRQTERRVFGIPAGECPEKQAVLDMPESSFLAAGSLAAEKGYVRAPVILNL